MRRGRLMAGMAAIAGGGVLLGVVVGTSIAGDQERMSEEEMMQKWMAYGSPGEHHRKMAKAVGTWDVDGTGWEYPGASPQKSTMTAKVVPILDGRYFVEEVEGSFEMGEQEMPFAGRNLVGYDNLKGKYVFVWIDSWMTGFITGEGTESADGKTITYTSDDWPNPMTGGFDEGKIVIERVNPDKHVSTFYKRGPDGEWFKNMKLVYTRAD